MRLYLSDSESRQVLTAGGVLIVRPAACQPVGSFTSFDDGTVHWTTVPDIDRLCGPSPMWRQTQAPWCPGDVVAGREAWQGWTRCSIEHGEWEIWEPIPEISPRPDAIEFRADGKSFPDRWRSPAVMPDWAVRHRLRVVRVECRQVGGISAKEALETGAPSLGLQINNGKEPIRRVRYDWEQRFGKRAPWDEGWAWFTWFEASK